MMFLDELWQFTLENWLLLLPVVLGLCAVYWVLPSARKSWAVPGAVAGALAFVLGGVFVIHHQFATFEGLLFYAFSGFAVLGAGLMLAQHNPVRAALSFALVVMSSCGLFLLLGAPFLTAATLIIYLGAIIITFLFVIMLAQQAGLASADRRSREPFLASLAGFVLLACLLFVLRKTYDAQPLDAAVDTLQRAARAQTAEEVVAILGDPKKSEDYQMPLLPELRRLFPDSDRQIENLNRSWVTSQFEQLKEQCANLIAGNLTSRMGKGSLQPAKGLPLSPFSGVPANEPLPTGPKERLPAANVAAIGKSLFTDYLVAVEMAGVLLLVATIGAIVIAGRRGEELR